MKKMTFFILTLLVLSTIGLQTTFAQDTLEGHTDMSMSVSFSPDGTTLASGSNDNTVKLWDVATRTNIATLEGHTSAVRSVAFSPDGTTLASGSYDETVKLWNVATRTNIATLEGHTNVVRSVSFSPDGTTLASGSWDNTVKLWDVATKQNIATLEGHEFKVISVSFSPDGTLFVSASLGRIKLWDVATHTNIATLRHTGGFRSVSFSPDGGTLASASWDDTVKLWDVATRTNIATLQGHTNVVNSVSFSPDGAILVSGSTDETVKLWDVETNTNIATLEGHTDGVSSVSFSPDGTTLASGSFDDTVKLWDVSEWMGTRPHTLVKISGDDQQGTFSSTLANPLANVEVRDWDNNPLPGVQVTFTVTYGEGLLNGESTVAHVTTDANGRAERTLTLGPDPETNTVEVSIGPKLVTFHAVGISPYQLVKISGDGQQGTFGSALANPLVVEVRDQDNNPLPGVEVTFTVTYGDGWLNGQFTVASVTTDANGRAAHTLTLEPGTNTVAVSIGHEWVTFNVVGVSPSYIAILGQILGHRSSVSSVSFSPDGTTLASGSYDNTVKLWDVATKQNIATLVGHTDSVTSVSFSPDGTLIASGSDDSTVKLWDVATGTNIATLRGHTYDVNSVSFSPDGTILASGSRDDTVKLWDVATRTNITTLEGHTYDVNSVSFSPDGKTFASGGGDRTVKLWDVATHTNIATLEGHTGGVSSVAFSPDGTTLASGTGASTVNGVFVEGTVKLWDVATSRIIAILQGHTSSVTSVSFSPDGTLIASGSDDSTVTLWDVATKNITTLQGHTRRVSSVSFSPDGTTLASGSWDGTSILWDMSPDITRLTDVSGPSAIKMNVTDREWGINPEVLNRDGIIIEFDEDIAWSSLKLTYEGGTDLGWESTVKDNSVTLTPIEGKELVLETEYVVSGTVRDGVGNETDLTLTFVTGILEDFNSEPTFTEDVNSDGIVNIQDLVLVASNLGKTGQNAADVNGDGVVNIQDLVLVAGALGSSAAAPSLNFHSLSTLTAADVKSWLSQARQLNLTDATSQRGILFLEQLLAALTPKETALLHNYPNPFNPETWIPYDLAKDAEVSLHIYAVNGTLVRTLALGHQAVGMYQSRSRAAHWDGRNAFGEKVASGLYFYTLTAGDFSATRKMLIRK